MTLPNTLPNTQPAEDSEPWSQFSQNNELPWAVLIPFNTRFSQRSYHLTEDIYKVGRDGECHKTLVENEFPSKIFPQISKIHFVIKKLNVNGTFVAALEDTSSNGTWVNGERVGKQNIFVLTHRDVISICPAKYKLFEFNDLRKEMFPGIPEMVKMSYSIVNSIGKGGFGAVYYVLKKKTSAPYAMKEITLAEPDKGANQFAEIEILRKIKHPNIIELHEFISTENKLFLLLEYMPGGDLLNLLKSNPNGLRESVAKHIFHQIVSGCSYLHERKIVHRDIKPANILLSDVEEEYPTVKITDFGLSKIMKHEVTTVRTLCGTRHFKAPELTNPLLYHLKCDDRVDVWSLGVVLYVCLCGKLPFSPGENKPSVEFQISKASLKFEPAEIWRGITLQGKILIKRCLEKSWYRRVRAREICEDPWFTEDEEFVRKHFSQDENDNPVGIRNKKPRLV